jgi:hypothetical protein
MQYFNDHQIQLAIICSLVSFAVTQIVKPFFKGVISKEKASALTRLSAVSVGALCGYTLTYTIIDMWLGAGIGGVNALIVKVLKARLKAQNSVNN